MLGGGKKMWRGRVGAGIVAGLLALVAFVSVNGAENSKEIDAKPIDAGHGDAFESHLELGEPQREFDYFVFAQQWPGTYCQQSGSCCQGVEEPVNFTVHGLWPEYNDGSWPSCCSGPGFDQAKIEELEDLLQEYWPTMSCRSPTQCSGRRTGSFWQHEWEKHGTCAYPIIPDEATYFTVGLNLRLQYDISQILNDAGFVPSSSEHYQTSEVFAAVQNAVGAQPIFSCKKKQINEIWVCFTQDLKIRDCGSSSNSCSQTLQIPPFE